MDIITGWRHHCHRSQVDVEVERCLLTAAGFTEIAEGSEKPRSSHLSIIRLPPLKSVGLCRLGRCHPRHAGACRDMRTGASRPTHLCGWLSVRGYFVEVFWPAGFLCSSPPYHDVAAVWLVVLWVAVIRRSRSALRILVPRVQRAPAVRWHSPLLSLRSRPELKKDEYVCVCRL